MQVKSEHYSEFSERTDQLAAALGKSVSSLTEVLKISNGMLFAYRTGKNPISKKAWSKLELAERHLKSGGKPDGVIEEPAGRYDAVASRLEFKKKMPSRSDCEAHLKQVLDAAEAEGSPENVPVIYHRLKKQLPLEEWDPVNPKLE